MKLRKLAALRGFIHALAIVGEENIQDWHIIEEYKPSGIVLSDTEVCFYDQSYQGIIRIERFPMDYGMLAFLIDLACWIQEYDPITYRFKVSRQDGKPIPLPDIDPIIDEESSETFSIELLVTFREPVFGIADVTGKYLINGVHYRNATDDESIALEPSYILETDYDSVEWRRSRTE
jgi:hypothetical protein